MVFTIFNAVQSPPLPILEHFHHLKKRTLHPLVIAPNLSPQPSATSDLFSVFVDLLVLDIPHE